ncbi:glutamine amidotransferase [Pelagovum pacificum]|uniref:Cytoplasmic protein n=1 Tax=Pelagovum pacificum TaxID=2588711 RepID=A0A5C5GDC0_9RHOB|nr:glutamine amidotransferase [Pelagovum pacificum]QQA44210.1 cytoplasmic protein [Pelagovum pacificum]TNY32668.1 cytoplasmic protein [Pelagovum pacificum]
MPPPRALLAGESWTTHSIHQKGFDSFTTTDYQEGGGWLIAALEGAGWEVTYQPAHVAARDFPFTADGLAAFDVVILSDIGANTLLLHPDTFVRGQATGDRLTAIRDYVAGGGGFIMIGGYLTFQGIDAKGQYAGTAIEQILPVTLSRHDDRVEAPGSVTPDARAHAITEGLGDWPALLGYNRLTAKPEAEVIATVGDDPLLALGQFGEGRSVAFASDCGPHWAPMPFVEWDGYAPLFSRMAGWAAGRL